MINLDQFTPRSESEKMQKASLRQQLFNELQGTTLFNEDKTVQRRQQFILNANIPRGIDVSMLAHWDFKELW